VSTGEIDRYLDRPERAMLAELRDTIVAIVPEAEQCISYGMPAFKLRGKTIAGFAAFKSQKAFGRPYRRRFRPAAITRPRLSLSDAGGP
jgi:uncharacterized protein YdhG (YjbR/CyaY superfamily)